MVLAMGPTEFSQAELARLESFYRQAHHPARLILRIKRHICWHLLGTDVELGLGRHCSELVMEVQEEVVCLEVEGEVRLTRLS